MTIEQIIKKYLKDGGFMGLCHPDEDCGCAIDDLFPCDLYLCGTNCQPAYLVPCDCPDHNGHHYQPEKEDFHHYVPED